jgi:tellurite resistance protein TerC
MNISHFRDVHPGALPAALWVPFAAVIVALIAFDLGLFQRNPREPTPRAALLWAGLWLVLSGLFGTAIYAFRGPKPGLEFFTGYVVEQALSVDNLFVILLIFTQLRVPRSAQRRVLVWGILGAVVLRGALILGGTALVARFHFLLYPLGAVLLFGACKLLRELNRNESASPHADVPLHGSGVRRLLARIVPVSDEYAGERFTLRKDGVLHLTPLCVALLSVEFADAIFALDSVPAVLAITTDPIIVFSSNLFAILGLRSMFFVLSAMLERLRYLKHGLVCILLVVGTKMLTAWLWTPPTWVTLALVLGILLVSVLLSLSHERNESNVIRS